MIGWRRGEGFHRILHRFTACWLWTQRLGRGYLTEMAGGRGNKEGWWEALRPNLTPGTWRMEGEEEMEGVDALARGREG